MFNCQSWAIRANLTFCAILRSSLRGRPFNSWRGGRDFWSSRIFFSRNLVGRIFFPFFSHKLSITFVPHAIFFFWQALAGNLFSKSPPPHPQELWSAPYIKTALVQSSLLPRPWRPRAKVGHFKWTYIDTLLWDNGGVGLISILS